MDLFERCLQKLLDLQTSDVSDYHLAAYVELLVEGHLRGPSKKDAIDRRGALADAFRAKMSATERSRHILMAISNGA